MPSTEIKFGTDGWREVIADGFTFDNVQIASNAIGKLILETSSKDWPILIGYDPRFLADKFAKFCANELISLGLKIKISNRIVPTPVIAYCAANFSSGKTNGAIQFTASHNPPKYCGLKYITNYGGPAPEEITDKIMENIRTQNSEVKNQKTDSHTLTSHFYFDPKPHYFSHLKKLIDFNKIKSANLKVVYDPLYGAGNTYLDSLLKDAGCSTICIHNESDPLFGGLLPEPREENLKELKEAVIKNNAIVGLATDGDADRLGAIDEKGIFYSPNKIAAMILRHLVKNKKLKGTVVRTLSTTHLMDHLAKKYNLEVIETKVGFKWICKEMLKGNVLIGAEESGGISILNHIPDKDAVLSGLLLVEMLAYENKTLSEIFNDTLKDALWHCINDKFDFTINEEVKNKFVSILQSKDIKRYGNLAIKSVNTSEGAKYLLDDGSWFMARASGTEPMARVYFEATSDKVLDEMKKTVRKIFEACQKQV